MNYTDLVIDYETLGKYAERDNFITLDASYVFFDIEKQEEYEDILERCKKFKFDTDEQFELGWKAETDTLNWWKSQDKEALSVLRPNGTEVKIREFVKELISDIKSYKPKRLWTRGIDFDLPILKRMFRATDLGLLEDYMRYNASCDIRTYIRAVAGFDVKDSFIPDHVSNKKFVKHDSRYDITMDVCRLQYINNL